MRCPDCNKFVSFDEADPEVDELEIDDDGQITCSVRITNTCAECGTELKEATLELEDEVAVDGHSGDDHELQIIEAGTERTSRSGYYKKGEWVSAGGRYAKTYYGADVSYEVTCLCGKLEAITGSIGDDVQASGMEEMV